jgi:UDP-N-acetylmuramoylalanine--D-glutamate ligase
LPHLDQLKKFVKRFYLIGEMSHEIEIEIKDLVEYVKLEKLDEVVNEVIWEKFSGVLLYSPGFPSFDQYANYAKRGEHFIKLLG